jgi:hypothetical protein
VRPLQNACAERLIQYALYFNNRSCGASVERLCSTFNLTHCIPTTAPMRPRWNASAVQQTCNYELLLNMFLRPRLTPTTSGRAMIPRVMNDYPQSGQPMAFLPKFQSPERSFLLHHPRSHFFLELLYQNKIKTTFVYSGELIVGSQAQVMRGRSFVYDKSHARSIN